MMIGVKLEKIYIVGMNKTRLEAFSDGVLAIIITIMVLELKTPVGTDLAALQPLLPTLGSYVLSFIFIGIYWSNHHHLLHLVHKVNGAVLWANLHLLFWLSLIPFVTAWMGEHHFAMLPVAAYGVVLAGAALAYFILSQTLIAQPDCNPELAAALGKDGKGKMSLAAYIIAVPLAFWQPGLSLGIYVLVALIWLAPDRRIEKFNG